LFHGSFDEGVGAEAFLELATMEGEPIYQILRAVPNGTIEIYTDASDNTTAADAAYSLVICDADGFNLDGGVIATGDCGPLMIG
jgi:hypothetical protein